MTSLPGKPFRRYIMACFSNLGNRYPDAVFAGSTRGPSMAAVSPISYTQRIPALARAIDEAMKERSTGH